MKIEDMEKEMNKGKIVPTPPPPEPKEDKKETSLTIRQPGQRHLILVANECGVVEQRTITPEGHLGAVEDDERTWDFGFGYD